MNKCYSELIAIPDFYDRIEYLRTKSLIGDQTFGSNRYLNQILYHSGEWRRIRRDIIIRDCGCDLAHPDFQIEEEYTKLKSKPSMSRRFLIHHINPITADDIYERRKCVFDPENLITTTRMTHLAIHYGRKVSRDEIVTRKPYDTCLWR